MDLQIPCENIPIMRLNTKSFQTRNTSALGSRSGEPAGHTPMTNPADVIFLTGLKLNQAHLGLKVSTRM
jgi:hypothetical protein